MQLIKSSVLRFLLLDVLTDGLLVSANRRYEVAFGPEILTTEVLFASKKLSCNVDGTLALDETNHLGNTVLGWNGDEQVNMVEYEMTFFHCTLFMSGQLPEPLAQMYSQLLVKRFPIPNDMIPALPDRMAESPQGNTMAQSFRSW